MKTISNKDLELFEEELANTPEDKQTNFQKSYSDIKKYILFNGEYDFIAKAVDSFRQKDVNDYQKAVLLQNLLTTQTAMFKKKQIDEEYKELEQCDILDYKILNVGDDVEKIAQTDYKHKKAIIKKISVEDRLKKLKFSVQTEQMALLTDTKTNEIAKTQKYKNLDIINKLIIQEIEQENRFIGNESIKLPKLYILPVSSAENDTKKQQEIAEIEERLKNDIGYKEVK